MSMLITPQSLDLAQILVRERVQQAANDHLADLLKGERRMSPNTTDSARLSLANALRNLAIRLDPDLGPEAYLAVPGSR